MFQFRIPMPTSEGLLLAPRPADPDEVLMDPQTYRDLEVFESEGGAPSLYDLCNQTRTLGGGRVLKARMRKPWNKAPRIRGVQESIGFIRANRDSFRHLPTDVIAIEVERYLDGALPLVKGGNRFEFLIETLEIRFGDFRTYSRIARGVQRTSRMVRLLGMVLDAAGSAATQVQGDLGRLLTELQTLIEGPSLAPVANEDRWEQSTWQVMQADRMFRLRERGAVERMLELIYEVDALVAMADAMEKYGFVMPTLESGPLHVVAEGIIHPFMTDPVANPLQLDPAQHMLFLTGPNMAGKTTYLRASGLAIYLAHLGMGVPARSFRFSPCECLFSSITVTDSVRSGISFFRAEALRVKAIAQALMDGLSVIAIMDEPFKGTNVKDALDASQAVFERFASRPGSLFMISSHLIELGDDLLASGQVDCQHFEASEHEDQLRFEYVLRPGVSSQRLGMRVLREEGIFDLLDE